MSASIQILMATFNGAEFLPDQLASISRQTHKNWLLCAADDGSTDETIEMLRCFAIENPGQVRLLPCSAPSGSAKGNFERLIQDCDAESSYVALCDQDDVWAPEKLARLLETCEALESKNGANAPCLVYSDLEVVDSALSRLSASFMHDMRVRPGDLTFGQLLVENSVPGCATLFNAALREVFRSHSKPLGDAIMHDWWLALLAAGAGYIDFVPEPLVRYRQHTSNVAGAVRRTGLGFWLKKLRGLRSGPYEATQRQARLLRALHGSVLTEPNRSILDAYCELAAHGKAGRVWGCIRHGVLKQGTLRRIHQLVAI